MGKYMRKSKTTGEVALLEVSHTQSSPLGVRTRAKTLALQRLQKSNSTGNGSGGDGGGGGGSYLQLRSRRLEKPNKEGKRQKYPLKDPNLPNPVKNNQSSKTSSTRLRQGHSWNSVSVEERLGDEKKEEINLQETQNEIKDNSCGEGGVEASFGENLLEFEGRERTTRESTPCSLIRDADNIQTPGSSTRPTNATEDNSRVSNSTRRHIPTAREMNDFFGGPEEQQQRQFIEKYNFDPVNDKPLPGRYEWEKVDR
ncbi:PREDICTED: cyclin-dependent kinase inhibitor 5-like [Nicotiana attenuata]|uniref:Cyclin-dependent kinase inhibitor 5 n=1 Tax=Nicotiana attenuata TaxID=49451 RepID=A0A314KMX3_NICAT|nr:PREDICTED: cyclin-dependent kinase inhibitor 5-like [Nicotiana attenuata]OIT30650.1 cyclin-dependent kinase inhibitor 5 [Nicotiana attenuata]